MAQLQKFTDPASGKSSYAVSAAKASDIFAGAKAQAQKAANVTVLDPSQMPGAAPAPAAQKTVEPTALSSANIDQKNQKNLQTVQQTATAPKGQIMENGVVLNADRSFAEAPSDAVQEVDQGTGQTVWKDSRGMTYAIGPSNGKVSSDPIVQGIYDNFTKLKSKMDATGVAQIQAIHDQYSALQNQQRQANAGAEAGTRSLLIRGGSQQTASSSGIMQSQVSYGLQKISELIAKENAAVVDAQAAAERNQMDVLDKMLGVAQEAREERQAAAAKVAEAVQNAQVQSYRDTQIGSVLAEGITGPTEILAKLKEQGVTNINSKQITDTLASLRPDAKAIMELMQQASTMGAPPEVLKKIGQAGSAQAALIAAGKFGAGGTGDIGEYNIARAQGYSGTLDDYITHKSYMSAYAREKGAAAGTAAGAVTGATAPLYAGLNSATATAVRQKVNDFKGEESVKNFNVIQDGYNFAKSLKTDTKNPSDDQAYIYSLAKVLDPASVVREGEYATVQKYSQSWIKAYGGSVNNAINGTGFLSQSARENIKKTIEARYNAQKTSYNNVRNQYASGIDSITGRDTGTKFLTEYSTDTNTPAAVVQDEKTLQSSIADWVSKSSQNQAAFNAARAMFPNASTLELAQQLGVTP